MLNISKNLSAKYSQKFIDHYLSAADAFKITSKWENQKTAEATGDLIGNKTTDKITKTLRTSPQNNLETVLNEEKNIVLDREILRERYMSPGKKQKIIDDLRKTSIIRSSLCDYNDAYIHVKKNYKNTKHWNSSTPK